MLGWTCAVLTLALGWVMVLQGRVVRVGLLGKQHAGWTCAVLTSALGWVMVLQGRAVRVGLLGKQHAGLD